MARVWGLLLVGFVAWSHARAASPDPATLVVSSDEMAEARSWIAKLNSVQFRDRESAMERLTALGRKALVPLADATNDPDPEIAERVRELYPRAAAADLEARVETFLADKKERYSHDLPGWSRFRAVVGSDPVTRDLFTEIVRDRANHELLSALGSIAGERRLPAAALIGGCLYADAESPPRGRVLQALANRRQAMQMKVIAPAFGRPAGFVAKQPTLPEAALVLMAESAMPEETLLFNAMQFNMTNFFYQQAARDAFQGTGNYAEVFRSLVRRWLDTRVGAAALANALNTSYGNKFEPELTLRIAGRMLTLPGGLPHTRTNALGMIGRLKGKEQFPLVLSCLTDDRIVANVGVPPNTTPLEVRDFALVTALYLTDQSPVDYGFLSNPNATDAVKFQFLAAQFRPMSKGPKPEELRTAAFEKWTTWELSTFGAAAGPLGPLSALYSANGRLAPKPANGLPAAKLP